MWPKMERYIRDTYKELKLSPILQENSEAKAY